MVADDVPREGKDQRPSVRGRTIRFGMTDVSTRRPQWPSARYDDITMGTSREVDSSIARTSRKKEFEIGKEGKERGREGRALAHGGDDGEGLKSICKC